MMAKKIGTFEFQFIVPRQGEDTSTSRNVALCLGEGGLRVRPKKIPIFGKRVNLSFR